MADPKPRTSFARVLSDTPGQVSRLECTPPVRTAFEPASDELRARESAAHKLTEAQRRESVMVKRSKPELTLRPPRALSLGPDRAAFDARWAQERQAAAPLHPHNRMPGQAAKTAKPPS